MSAHNEDRQKVTTRALRQMKASGVKIASITAYDAAFAQIIEGAGIDFILVGDSGARSRCANGAKSNPMRSTP